MEERLEFCEQILFCMMESMNHRSRLQKPIAAFIKDAA
jgi:hypothetical protein